MQLEGTITKYYGNITQAGFKASLTTQNIFAKTIVSHIGEIQNQVWRTGRLFGP
jgi:hypothetical protein